MNALLLLGAAWLAVAILAGLAIAAAIRCGRRLDLSIGTPAADQAAIQRDALARIDRALDTRPGSDHNALAACEAIWTTARKEGTQ